jgi:hypothetical protein
MEAIKFLSSNELGYLSLAVCILTKSTIDEAFDKIAPDPDADRRNLRQQEDEDIISLRRDGVSWQNIGKILNMSSTAVFRRAKRYKEKETQRNE